MWCMHAVSLFWILYSILGIHIKRSSSECEEIKYGEMIHSKVKANSGENISYPFVEVKHVIKDLGSSSVTVRYQRVVYPVETLSVLEPLQPGTCQLEFANKTTTTETSARAKCTVAVSGGFFNANSSACLGNIVSNSILVQNSAGIQHAHFGITENGYIYIGYLSELDLITQKFKQLIGGVLWIIRDGEIYIDKSKEMECSDTGGRMSINKLINIKAARSAVGHDKEGRVILVQLDGKTEVHGATLYEFAGILLEMGVVNAVNLDGGGSVTTVINNTLVNYPSDECVNSTFSCEREITTILCVHEPYCDPKDCNQHGDCILGKCICSGFWSGKDCNTFSCVKLKECYNYGNCSAASSCLVVSERKSNQFIDFESDQYFILVGSTISISVVAALSISLNIRLIYFYVISNKRHQLNTKRSST